MCVYVHMIRERGRACISLLFTTCFIPNEEWMMTRVKPAAWWTWLSGMCDCAVCREREREREKEPAFNLTLSGSWSDKKNVFVLILHLTAAISAPTQLLHWQHRHAGSHVKSSSLIVQWSLDTLSGNQIMWPFICYLKTVSEAPSSDVLTVGIDFLLWTEFVITLESKQKKPQIQVTARRILKILINKCI